MPFYYSFPAQSNDKYILPSLEVLERDGLWWFAFHLVGTPTPENLRGPYATEKAALRAARILVGAESEGEGGR